MSESYQIKVIARIKNDFKSKFGVPRQSGTTAVQSVVVFEPEYRNADALRGLEEFSHVWLLWCFDRNKTEGFSPTVRPPRLGGNKRVGVFATRSPNRPNPIGLSSVRLCEIKKTVDLGTVLVVEGADLMDGTAIFDVKPYLPYSDLHSEATGGFTDTHERKKLEVKFLCETESLVGQKTLSSLKQVLSEDPRPAYQADENREYGLDFADLSVRFKVSGELLTVISIEKSDAKF